jgi:hypothetical protein
MEGLIRLRLRVHGRVVVAIPLKGLEDIHGMIPRRFDAKAAAKPFGKLPVVLQVR